MVQGKSTIQHLSPYQQGKQTEEIKQEFGLTEIIKLASNENPYGSSPTIKEGLMDVIDHANIYPDGYVRELRNHLTHKYSINEHNLVFGSGSDELIQLITRAFLTTDAHTVMASNTFSQYKHNATIEGAAVDEIETVNGFHDLKGMLAAITEQTKIVWICNPDNPSGTIVSKEDFYAFMDACPKHVLVVLDEAYVEFSNEMHDLSAIESIDTHENLLILRTLSKAYGLAGLRVAYGIGHEEIIRQLDIVRGPFNTNALAQRAALLAIKDDSFLTHVVESNRAVRSDFESFLTSIDWIFYPSETNFILVNTPISGYDMFTYLIKHGFIVRPGELLGYPNTVRISIGLADEMKQLQNVMSQFNEQLNKEI